MGKRTHKDEAHGKATYPAIARSSNNRASSPAGSSVRRSRRWLPSTSAPSRCAIWRTSRWSATLEYSPAIGVANRVAHRCGCAAGRAAVARAPGRAGRARPHLELRDFDPPHPGPGEILIEVKCALSCGTDLKTFRRGHPMWHLPTPFGHEFSGVVAEVGEGRRRLQSRRSLDGGADRPLRRLLLLPRGQENLCPQCDGKDGAGRVCRLPAAAGARRRAQRLQETGRICRSKKPRCSSRSPASSMRRRWRGRRVRDRADSRRGAVRPLAYARAQGRGREPGGGRGTRPESPGMGGRAGRRPW